MTKRDERMGTMAKAKKRKSGGRATMTELVSVLARLEPPTEDGDGVQESIYEAAAHMAALEVVVQAAEGAARTLEAEAERLQSPLMARAAGAARSAVDRFGYRVAGEIRLQAIPLEEAVESGKAVAALRRRESDSDSERMTRVRIQPGQTAEAAAEAAATG